MGELQLQADYYSKDKQLTDFARAVKYGLETKNKRIQSKYLYDDRGSELFVEITKLPEYYPTACELEILNRHAHDLLDLMPDKLNTIVELGAGEGQKSEIILKEAFSRDNEIQFVPVDISQNSIDTLVHRLHLSLPDLRINSFHGDYFDYLSGKSANFQGRRLFLLLGANIGNLNPKEGMEFLRQIGSYMAKDECLVVGFDLKKEISIMDKAYNDNKGVTSEFNFNLLTRMNRELGANFDRNNFYHHGIYNAQLGAMQSFLVAKKAHVVHIEKLKMKVTFDMLEPIHIENSFKYSKAEIQELARKSGFEIIHNFYDGKHFFVDSVWKILSETPSEL